MVGKEKEMLRLADIIFRGRKKKGSAGPEKPRTAPSPVKEPTISKGAAPVEKKAPAPRKAQEVPAGIEGEALENLIKGLEMTYDEKEEAYYIGRLAYLKTDDLKGINPVMAGKKIENAIAQALVERHQADPKQVEEALGKYRKKFKNFGTTLYVQSIKDKMSGTEKKE